MGRMRRPVQAVATSAIMIELELALNYRFGL